MEKKLKNGIDFYIKLLFEKYVSPIYMMTLHHVFVHITVQGKGPSGSEDPATVGSNLTHLLECVLHRYNIKKLLVHFKSVFNTPNLFVAQVFI